MIFGAFGGSLNPGPGEQMEQDGTDQTRPANGKLEGCWQLPSTSLPPESAPLSPLQWILYICTYVPTYVLRVHTYMVEFLNISDRSIRLPKALTTDNAESRESYLSRYGRGNAML